MIAHVLLTQPKPMPRTSISLWRSARARPTIIAANTRRGDGEERVDEDGQDTVGPPRRYPLTMPTAVPQMSPIDDAGHADQQRDAGAVDAAGEDVPSVAVAAEPEVGARTVGVVAGAVEAAVREPDERQVVGEEGRNSSKPSHSHAERAIRSGILRRRFVGSATPTGASVAAAVAVGAISVMRRHVPATSPGGSADRRRSTGGRRSRLPSTTITTRIGDDRLDHQQVVLLDGEHAGARRCPSGRRTSRRRRCRR